MTATLTLAIGSLIYWQDIQGLSSLMPASFQKVFIEHEYWRAWSTNLAHSNEKHLLSNSFFFFIFSFFLSGYFNFLLFPLAAFFFGGVINFLVLRQMPETAVLIGASGIVYWMGAVWLSLYTLLETKLRLGQRLLRAAGVALALFFPTEAFDPQVSYQSHFLGFIFGILVGVIYYFFKRKEFLSAEVRELVSEDL